MATKKEEENVEKEKIAKAAKKGTNEEGKKEKAERKEKIDGKSILEKKAKELEGKITKKEKGKLKEKLKESVKKKETLVPLEDYVKYGSYIGTKVIVPHMRKFVYKRRADGIAIINTNHIDEKLQEMIKYLASFNPEDVIIVCKREGGWQAVNLFSKYTGIKAFTKKYPAGIITNTSLPNFLETDLVFVCDPWVDKNALKDAVKTKKRVAALCDTNNYTFGIEQLVPCNNKSNRSLGLIFYILTKGYLKEKGIEKDLPPVEEFIGEVSK